MARKLLKPSSLIDMKKFGNFSIFTPQTVSFTASSVSISKNKSN